MADKTNKFIGFLESAKVFISGSDARKDKLIDWLGRFEKLEAESAELDKQSETLPQEIDTILASGEMTDKAIETLARKRATLDLIPGRQEKIGSAFEALEAEFEGASALVEATARKGLELYCKKQLEAAISDLKKLGVSEEIAERQALVREDIRMADPYRMNVICGSSCAGDFGRKARNMLWAFESLEAGLHPDSPDAEKFKKRWKAQL